MVISARAKFLVENIRKGKTTYLAVVEKYPELKAQIDAYIELKGYDVDKTK